MPKCVGTQVFSSDFIHSKNTERERILFDCNTDLGPCINLIFYRLCRERIEEKGDDFNSLFSMFNKEKVPDACDASVTTVRENMSLKLF